MADSIQDFVQKLQKEGVEAGRAEAAKLAEEAKARAEKTIADAKVQADRIVAQARKQAAELTEQGRNELQLAARDVLLRLRESILAVLEAVLGEAATETLNDDKFLAGLLHDICVQYAERDAVHDWPVEINVSAEKLKTAAEWAISEMTRRSGQDWRSRVDLKGKLKTAGFEYKASGGTVEVTPESIASVLSEMITPRLRELIGQVLDPKGS